MWGQGTYDPDHALLGPKARAEEGICRGRIGKGRDAGGTAEDDLVLGTPRLQREEQRLIEGCPQKSPMKEMRVEWDPRGGYGAKLVQGKYVPSALNAPANVLTMLMRKDAWTG